MELTVRSRRKRPAILIETKWLLKRNSQDFGSSEICEAWRGWCENSTRWSQHAAVVGRTQCPGWDPLTELKGARETVCLLTVKTRKKEKKKKERKTTTATSEKTSTGLAAGKESDVALVVPMAAVWWLAKIGRRLEGALRVEI